MLTIVLLVADMRINWRRIFMAGIWPELLLLAVCIPARTYGGLAFLTIALATVFGSMFLGGLWVARKLRSRFVMHGALVGIFNIFIYAAVVVPMLASIGHNLLVQLGLLKWTDSIPAVTFAFIFFGVTLKLLGSTLGAYVGGRWQRKLHLPPPAKPTVS